MTPRRIVFCAFVLFVVLNVTHAQTNIGDNCKVQNKPGKCILLDNCEKARSELQNKRIFPQICAFEGTVPIVCCEQAATTTTTTAPTSKTLRKVGDISRQKCFEYSLFNYELVRPPVLAATEKVNVSVCAHKVVPLIIGGEAAKAREFPHMALLGYGDAANRIWQCGGALVSERFVLTAGHCLFAQEQGLVNRVRLGDLDIKSTKDDARPVEFDIEEIIKHPEYKPPSNYNDIALLRLNGTVKLNKYVIPACLHREREIPAKRYLATGWGRTEYGGDGSDVLLKVILDGFSQEQCNKTYRADSSTRRLRMGILPDSQLCAGGSDSEKDTCQGDSGGPLQIFHSEAKCMYSLVGVTSFGKTCGVQNIPGVYSRVSHYVPWIESVVWPL